MRTILFALLVGSSISVWAGIGTGFTYKADQIMENHDDQILSLRGSAVITQGSHKLMAQKIVINKKSGSVLALDEVSYDDGKDSAKAERMLFKVSGQKWKRKD